MKLRHGTISVGTAALVLACAPDPLLEEQRAVTSRIVMPPCGAKLNEVDGVWAYSNGPNEGTGDSCEGRTAINTLRFQCVEFAQRYMFERYGVAQVWDVAVAAEMCRRNPTGTTVHWVGDGYTPKRGDLAVWTINDYGHVAVVRDVDASGIEIVEQNGAWSTDGTRKLAGDPRAGFASPGGSPVACFVSADRNATSTAPAADPARPPKNPVPGRPAASCALGDGHYCGGNGGGDDRGTLYWCASGKPRVSATCDHGCEWRPDREHDRCRTSATCRHGAGLYCGGNGVSGDPNVLFRCGGGRIDALGRCRKGCRIMPPGKHDECVDGEVE